MQAYERQKVCKCIKVQECKSWKYTSIQTESIQMYLDSIWMHFKDIGMYFESIQMYINKSDCTSAVTTLLNIYDWAFFICQK